MNKKKLIQNIQREVLNQAPEVQAQTINELDPAYVLDAINFILKHGKKEFLPFLSVPSLIILVRYFFECFKKDHDELPIEKWNNNLVKDFKHLITLPKFASAWRRVQYDEPNKAFCLIPEQLLKKTISGKLAKIVQRKSYIHMLPIIQSGTYANKMLSYGLVDEDVPQVVREYSNERKRWEKLIKSLGKPEDVEWIVQLLRILSARQKLNFLYSGTWFTSSEISKLFCICVAQGGHISDDRQNPISIGLGLLDFVSLMERDGFKYEESIEVAVEHAVEALAEHITELASKTGATSQFVNILDFFFATAYSGKRIVVQNLPMVIVKELLTQRKCLWIQSFLSADQKIALKALGSINALDAVKALSGNETESLLPATVQKINSLSLKEKIQVIIQT